MNITLNIPHADQARETVTKGRYERAQKQAREVEAAINKAISNGAGGVCIDGQLDRPVVVELESKGYKVKHESHRNEEAVMISWAT